MYVCMYIYIYIYKQHDSINTIASQTKTYNEQLLVFVNAMCEEQPYHNVHAHPCTTLTILARQYIDELRASKVSHRSSHRNSNSNPNSNSNTTNDTAIIIDGTHINTMHRLTRPRSAKQRRGLRFRSALRSSVRKGSDIYIYIYTHICVHTLCIHIRCKHIYIYIYIYMYMYTYISLSLYIYIYMNIHRHIDITLLHLPRSVGFPGFADRASVS